jgi:hypothetical protein
MRKEGAMTGDGFLFEYSAVADGPWMCDAPWVRANGRLCHGVFVRAGGIYPMRVLFSLARIKAKNLLSEVFYGDTGGKLEGMMGLSAMFGGNGIDVGNVLDGGERGPRRTSIWLLGWCSRGVYMVSDDGNPVDHIGDAAIVVQDWRFVVRIANVGPSTTDIVGLLEEAGIRVPLRSDDVRPMFYMNASALGLLRDAGRRTDCFSGIPIREVAELRDDESVVGGG